MGLKSRSQRKVRCEKTWDPVSPKLLEVSHTHLMSGSDSGLGEVKVKVASWLNVWVSYYRASAVAASPVLATVGMSVCPSVCLSVTRWHCVKTTQARITKSSPTDSPRTLVFRIKNSSRNSTGVTLSEGAKWEWGRKNSQFSANNNSPYLRNGARYDQSYY